ncbi:hypothetical protein LTR53_000891, partial [Teratosphaeriaceae sp. CCFEE 6253]
MAQREGGFCSQAAEADGSEETFYAEDGGDVGAKRGGEKILREWTEDVRDVMGALRFGAALSEGVMGSGKAVRLRAQMV